jgi:hypothetical protein
VADQDEMQTCPSCGKSEPEVTFDADTCTLDCDECVGFRFAFSRAYAKARQGDATGRYGQGRLTMAAMRAKMRVETVSRSEDGNHEFLRFRAVGPKGSYPADGSDEDNTFAKWTPCADLSMTISNPALVGKFIEGQTFYVDFTEVDPKSRG